MWFPLNPCVPGWQTVNLFGGDAGRRAAGCAGRSGARGSAWLGPVLTGGQAGQAGRQSCYTSLHTDTEVGYSKYKTLWQLVHINIVNKHLY